ncbi:MAG: ECF-type sigma factor [Acidobacteriota bacterium]
MLAREMAAHEDVTRLLRDLAAGAPQAEARLLDVVYDELRQLAHRHRGSWRRPPVGTHSLVHEAYMKLVDQTHVKWQCRGQFFAIASRAMRSVLVDNARHRRRLKREGGRERVELEDAMLVSEARSDDVVAVDEALQRLAAAEPRLAAIVECRFFGGLTVEETSEALDLSPATVKRDWVAARTWLYRELHGARDAGVSLRQANRRPDE